MASIYKRKDKQDKTIGWRAVVRMKGYPTVCKQCDRQKEVEVIFDKPKWQGTDISSDIVDDFYMLAKEIPSLSKEQREQLYYTGNFTFDELQVLLKKNGYS